MTFDPRVDVPHTESPYWQPPAVDGVPEVVSLRTSWHPAVRALQVATYIVVIVTCLAVLYGLVELALFVDRLQVALQNFSEGLAGL